MTYDARMYSKLGKKFAEHGSTLHSIKQSVMPRGSPDSHQHGCGCLLQL